MANLRELFERFRSELLGNNCLRDGDAKNPQNATHTFGAQENALAKTLTNPFFTSALSSDEKSRFWRPKDQNRDSGEKGPPIAAG